MTDPWVAYQLAHMPAPFLGVWGTKWAELIGGAKQDASDLSTDATLARFPITAPADALPYLGRDRRILRAPGETDAAYADRLRRAFSFWALSGTEAGILAAFSAAGLTALVVENQDTANAFGHWARFAVYVTDSTAFDPPPTWNGFSWDDGTRWDFTAADGALVDYLVASIRVLKPSDTRCVGLVIDRPGYVSVIVPVDPTPVSPPLSPVGLMPAYLDAYLDFYLG